MRWECASDGEPPRSATDGGRVQRRCVAAKGLEGLLIDLVSLMEVNGAPRVPFEAGVEEICWILERGSLGEGELHLVLVGLAGADHPVVVPHRDPSPLPLLVHFGD